MFAFNLKICLFKSKYKLCKNGRISEYLFYNTDIILYTRGAALTIK